MNPKIDFLFLWANPNMRFESLESNQGKDLGFIPFDQSESGFFNRKLDQIADQLEHKIGKWICFHTEVPGSRLPWEFWTAVHVIKQSIMRLINQLIKWNKQSETSLRWKSEWSASGDGSFGLQSKMWLWWNRMKISFSIEESRFRLVNFEGMNPNLDSLDLKSKCSIGKG